MKAIVLKQAGGVENFHIENVDKPTVNENEVLIEVKAISINPIDWKVRAFPEVLTMIYGDKRPAVLGWDIAGTVVEVGEKVTKYVQGDRVFGMVNFPGQGNAYAEYIASPTDHLAKIPEGISFEDAAATTLAALTALQVLRERVNTGDRVLIHAGSGGVGHFAVQIAKHLGATVISTSSSKNRDFVKSLGADQHIDYTSQKLEDEISNIDFVLDMFNGDVLANSLKVVKDGGAVVSLPTHEFPEEVMNEAAKRNIDVSFQLVQSSGEDMEILANHLAKGTLKPFVSKRFTFEEMSEAHIEIEKGRSVGKTIVTFN